MMKKIFGNARAALLLAIVSFTPPATSWAVTTTGYEEFGDTAGVVLWRGTEANFHASTVIDVDEDGTPGEPYTMAANQSATSWQRFAGNQSAYTSPGMVLVYDTPGTGDGYKRNSDAQFAPLSFGGMWVQTLAINGQPFSILGTGNRLTEFGATGKATLFKFDASYTIDRSGTTTFYGDATVDIADGATFTAQARSGYSVAVASAATLKLKGSGTLAVTTMNVAGTLDLSAETVPMIDGNVALNGDATLVVPAGTEFPFEVCSGTLTANGLVYVKVGGAEPVAAELTVSGGTITEITTEIETEQTFTSDYPSVVPAGFTYTYEATEAVTIPAVTVNGTLKTSGPITITNFAIASGADFEVVAGNTTVGNGGGTCQLKGNITIDAGATLTNTKTDTLDYNGSMTVDIYGTLAMGYTRWSIPRECTFKIHAGAEVTGPGETDDISGCLGALDFINSANYKGLDVYGAEDSSLGTVVIEGAVRIRNDQSRFWIATNTTLVLRRGIQDGVYFDASFNQVGPGTLEIHDNAVGLNGDRSYMRQGTLRLVDTTVAFPVELQNSNSYLEIVATDADTTVPVEIYCIDYFHNNNISFSGEGKVSGSITKKQAPGGTLAPFLQSSAWMGTFVADWEGNKYSRFDINSYGNANSVVEVTQLAAGYVSDGSVANFSVIPTVDVSGTMTLDNGYSGKTTTFTKLTGSGTVTFNNYTCNITTLDNFTGVLTHNTGTTIDTINLSSTPLSGDRIVCLGDGAVINALEDITVSINGVVDATIKLELRDNGIYVAEGPMPEAAWYGDFSAGSCEQYEGSGYTIENWQQTHGEKYSSVTIDRANQGLMVDFAEAKSAFTVLVKYSNLETSSSNKRVLFATTVNSDYTRNRCGVRLLTDGTVQGLWNTSTSSNNDADYGSASTDTVPSAGTLAFVYDRYNGTSAYVAGIGESLSDTALWSNSALKAGDMYGFAVGGSCRDVYVAGVEAAQGMTIEGIAVFTNSLAVAEMNSYRWRNTKKYSTYSTYSDNDTTPSAGNANIPGQSFKLNADNWIYCTSEDDVAATTSEVQLDSITVYWGENAGSAPIGTNAGSQQPDSYLVLTTTNDVIVGISDVNDAKWTANGSSTYTFEGVVISPSETYRLYFATDLSDISVGGTLSRYVSARVSSVWHGSERESDDTVRAALANTFNAKCDIKVSSIYGGSEVVYTYEDGNVDVLSIGFHKAWRFEAGVTRTYQSIGTLNSKGAIEITNAATLVEGTYTLATWTTPQQYKTQCAGYGKVGTLVTDGLAEGLSARLIYGARGIYLRVDDSAKQAARKPLVVWCYGDSITEGYNAQATGANYRILLYQKLEMLGYNVRSTGVYGLSNGYNSVDPSGTALTDQYKWHSAKHGATAGPTTLAHRSNLSENVDTLAIQAGTPDVALLLIGVNDIPEWKNEADRVTPVFKAWTNVVSRMVKNLPDTKIVVSTILYSDGTRTDIDPTITAINTQIKNLFDNLPAAWQGHVVLADLNSIVKSGEPGIIYSDHLHPDWWGYDQMADGYLDAIVNCYPDPDATDFPSQNPIPAAPTVGQLGAANKPELADYRAGFKKLCNIRVEKGQDVNNVVYGVMNNNAASNNIEKVGYFVEFVRADNHAHKWVWVDMDAFGNADLASVGLPQRNYQQAVTRMHVCSNHGAIDNVAADDDSVTGWIEFSPYNYNRAASNSAAPENYGEPFDWNDTLSTSGSYGCMQVFRVMNPSSRDLYERPQLMFAFNNFQSENGNPADFGIGNFAQHFNCNNSYHTEDWTGVGGTLAKMAPDQYSVKTIEIWTKASGEEKSEFFSGRLADTPYNDGLGSNSSGRYRIPAIAKSTNDVVVAIYDCRYNGSGDLPNALDAAESWSGDGGRTWSQPRIGIDVPDLYVQTTTSNAKSYNFGDPCILFDPAGNKFWAMGITGGGLASPRDNSGNSISDVVLYTRGTNADDEWEEWTGGPEGNKRSVKQMILDALAKVDSTANSDENQIRGILQGPGHGMVQQKTVTNELGEVIMPAGALVFPMQYFSSLSNFNDAMTFAVYSTNGGATWKSTKLTQADQNAQENCVMELDDGSWYMICKGRTNSDKKRQLFRTTNYKDWTYCGSLTQSEWVQGSCLRLGQGGDGRGRYAACFSPSGRANITLYFGRDTTAADPDGNGIEWNYSASTNIYPYATGGMGYNSLVMLDDTTLGVLLETNGHIELLTVDVSGIVVPATPDTSVKARIDGVEYATVFDALRAAFIQPFGTVVEVLDGDYDIASEDPDVLLYFTWDPDTRTFTRQNAVIENVIEGVDVLNVSIDESEMTATFTLRINIDANAAEEEVRANLMTKGLTVYKGNTLDDLDLYHVESLSALVGSDSTDMLYIAQLDEADTKFYRFAVSDSDGIVSSDIIRITCTDNGHYVVQIGDAEPDKTITGDIWNNLGPITVSVGETIRFYYNLSDIDENWFGMEDGVYKFVLANDSGRIVDENIWNVSYPSSGSFDWTVNAEPGVYLFGVEHDDFIEERNGSRYITTGCCFELTVNDSSSQMGVVFDVDEEGVLIGVTLNGNTEVTIPADVTAIADEVFAECDSLTSVTIPETVTRIGHRAFRSCSELTGLIIPDSVTSKYMV